MSKSLYLSFFLFGLMFFVEGFAAPNQVLIRSRIVKPDGTNLEASSVQFRLSVTDPTGACILFQEDFPNQNMTASKGFITLSLGGGTKMYPAGAMSMTSLFNDYGSPAFTCNLGGTYNPSVNDIRQLVMQFNDGSGWQTVPASPIQSVPYALETHNSHKLGDYAATDYVRLANFPTCTAAQALFFNGTALSCVSVSSSSGTVTTVTSANADIGIINGTSTPQLTLNSGTGANQIVKLNGTSQLPAVSGVNLTNLNATNLASGTVPAAQMPALTGDVTMAAGTTSTSISGLARSKLAAGSASHVLINDGSGAMSSESQLAISRGGTGASAFTGNSVVVSNAGGSALTALSCTSGQIIKFDGSGFATCGSDSTGSASQWTTASSDIYYNTGKVGIGTASPDQLLHLSGASAFAHLTSTGAASRVGMYFNNTSTNFTYTVAAEGSAGGEWFTGTIPYSMVLGTAVSKPLHLVTSNTVRATFDASGNVGIGTSSPRSSFDVQSGSIIGKPATSNATATINFATGNIQYTADNCGAFQFDNLKDGGSYTFIVKGTSSATCSFTAFSDAGVTPLTVHMPPDLGATTASKHTIFSIIVGGSDIYVAWTPGY